MNNYATHTQQVDAAVDLVAARSTPELREVLSRVLAEQCGTRLPEADLDHVLDALTEPVAFALSQARDFGRMRARQEVHQSIANVLGLGSLAPTEGS